MYWCQVRCRICASEWQNFCIFSNGTDISNASELPSIYGDVCVLDTKNRERGKRRIEAETAKKSLFVIISFLAFTLPYPLLVTVEKVLCLGYHQSIYELQYCFNIMSLLSAGLNPLVYGLANRQFRNAFRKICHRYYRRYKSRDYLWPFLKSQSLPIYRFLFKYAHFLYATREPWFKQ